MRIKTLVLLLSKQLTTILTENFLLFRKLDFLASVGAGEMEVFIALCIGTCDGGSVLVANMAFLVHKFGLLLVKVDELSVFYFEYFVGPEGTADVNIHVELIRDESARDIKLTFLFA